MDVDILIEDARWQEIALSELAQKAILATLAHLDIDSDMVEASVLACDDAHITKLNSEFREKPKPTNVLSWPAVDLAAENAGEQPNAPEPDAMGDLALGDIAIAYETCVREAQELGKPVAEHVMHILVHGTLHLLGYDHIRDPDATLMQAIEGEILGKMGIDDPYKE